MLRRIIQIGFPAGLESAMYSISNVIVQTGVNGLGTDSVAAWAAYGKVDGLFWMMVTALGIPRLPLSGRITERERRNVFTQGVRVCMGLAV